MKENKSSLNFLKVNRDERSSLFVLDLKENERADESVKIKKEKRDFAEFLKNIKHNFYNILKFFKQTRNRKILEKIKTPKPEPIKFASGQEDIIKTYSKKLDELAFLSIIKILILFIVKIFKFIYITSYKVGWYLVCGIGLVASLFSRQGRDWGRLLPFATKNSKEIKQPAKALKKANYKTESFKNIINFLFEFFKANFTFRKTIKQKKIHVIKKENKKFEFLKSDIEEPILDISIRKSALKFAIVLFIIILPFKILSFKSMSLADLKGRVLGASEAAIASLMQAGGSMAAMDFGEANSNFSAAGENFFQAQNEINEINNIFFNLLKIIPNEEARFASESKKILAGGQIASELGGNFSLALGSIFENKDKNLIEIIDLFVYYGEKSLDDIGRLNKIIADINIDNLPEEYRDIFASLKKKSAIAESGLKEFIGLADELKEFLGSAYDKRYLLVFQNNTEMRATGGFIGSYALIDFSNGRIKNLEAPGGGSYDTEGGLKALVQAPEPLQLVSGLWYFWDANWWPDWSKSAKKLMWFYEKSDGSTVDGVISLTPTVLEDLLEIMGPIDMSEKYGVVLDSENFWNVTQAIVEDKEIPPAETTEESEINNAPKRIIGDLLDRIIDEFPKRLDKEKFVKLLSSFEKNLSEKHVLFYFNNEELQAEIERLGWDGRMKDFSWDYLSVINTNIAGGKSDKMIRESLDLKSEILENGEIINTLKIKREHTGEKEQVFVGVRNVDWIRVYVPLGSELIETSGFEAPHKIFFDEIDPAWQKDNDVSAEEESMKEHGSDKTKFYEDGGKTVFANWSMIDPGQTAEIIIRYKLPFKLEKKEIEATWLNKFAGFFNPDKKQLAPYAIYFQKQSGSLGSLLSYRLDLSDNMRIAAGYPVEKHSDKLIKFENILNTDKFEALLIEQ